MEKFSYEHMNFFALFRNKNSSNTKFWGFGLRKKNHVIWQNAPVGTLTSEASKNASDGQKMKNNKQ